VGPLKDDTSEQIVSWVDGQVVTNWAVEIMKRERAIEGYLADTDPVHAEKYGFRSVQNPQLAWSWFRNNPVGFNGVPYVLFKTILDLDPNHENPALRAIARIWKREATVPTESGVAASTWTLDHIGVRPSLSDYVDGVARPVTVPAQRIGSHTGTTRVLGHSPTAIHSRQSVPRRSPGRV
jgi:hypothetical protein